MPIVLKATGMLASISTKCYKNTSFKFVFVDMDPLLLKKLLDEERKRVASLPQDTRERGVLHIPDRLLSAPLLEGPAQRNVPAILKMVQDEMRKEDKKKQRATARQGEGMSLPLSRGIMTGPMDKVMSFMSVFQ